MLLQTSSFQINFSSSRFFSSVKLTLNLCQSLSVGLNLYFDEFRQAFQLFYQCFSLCVWLDCNCQVPNRLNSIFFWRLPSPSAVINSCFNFIGPHFIFSDGAGPCRTNSNSDVHSISVAMSGNLWKCVIFWFIHKRLTKLAEWDR